MLWNEALVKFDPRNDHLEDCVKNTEPLAAPHKQEIRNHHLWNSMHQYKSLLAKDVIETNDVTTVLVGQTVVVTGNWRAYPGIAPAIEEDDFNENPRSM